MPSVREATYDLLREWGVATVFGNPGSNELPFLDGFPADFRYVLGLHESGVLAMADGFAQATGRPALVNLHSAAGLGNAMGNLANARAAQTPLVVTAGQQARPLIGLGSMLGEPAMTRVPEPQVKWSLEPARAQDIPRALSEAFHLAMLPPAGPVFLSLPLDDWSQEVDADDIAHLPGRRVRWAGAAAPDLAAELVTRLRSATSPAIVVGPESDDDAVTPSVVELAERLNAPVWIAPSPPRCPFPTRHPLFRGVLPASVAGVSDTLAGRDLVLVLGAPVFRYHHNKPGAWLPAGTELIAVTGDPTGAARPAFGDAVVGDVGAITAQLLVELPDGRDPERWEVREVAGPDSLDEVPFSPDGLFTEMNRLLPDDVRIVKEAASNSAAFWSRLTVDRPRSVFSPAAGGLGFGLPAAVGVALADPRRPVVAVLGDGSAQYGITGLWTAVQLDLPITFVVMRNGGYEALRRFIDQMGVTEPPGLDLPGMDAVRIAEGYGMRAQLVSNADGLAKALHAVSATDGPRLLEIPVLRH